MKGVKLMGSTITCCYQCMERQVGCHSTCELYKTQKEEWEKERKKRNAEQMQKYARKSEISKAIKRMKRGKK